jgi:hypothetical protein
MNDDDITCEWPFKEKCGDSSSFAIWQMANDVMKSQIQYSAGNAR